MSLINETPSLKKMRDLLRPLFEKNVFKTPRIDGFEDIHENIGLILKPCTNEQFHTTAVQVVKIFRLLLEAEVNEAQQKLYQEIVELSTALEKIDLNN